MSICLRLHARTTQLYGSPSLLCSLPYTFRYIPVTFSKPCARATTLRFANPRRACAARVTVLRLCVCYHFFSPTTRYTAHNHRLQRDMRKVSNLAFSLLMLRSKINMLMSNCFTRPASDFSREDRAFYKSSRRLNAAWNTKTASY